MTSIPAVPRPARTHMAWLLAAALLAACGGGGNDDNGTAAATALGPFSTASAPGCQPDAPRAAPAQDFITLCWGAEGWHEPTLDDKALQQNLDFYPAPAQSAAAPLIVWAHPNGMSKELPEGSALRRALLPPARDAGYAFASLEFRHPVTNASPEPGGPVPHTDIAQALSYLVTHAQALRIDPRNIFLVGQSRGTLGVWTAMQPDSTSPPVRAVFAVNAQTSYRGEDFAQWFLVQPHRELFLQTFHSRNPNADRYGSAVRDVTRQAPPIQLRYDSPVVGRPLTLTQMQQQDALHYPDFGPALCNAYAAAQATASCSYVADARLHDHPALAYEGYVQFFDRHRAR